MRKGRNLDWNRPLTFYHAGIVTWKTTLPNLTTVRPRKGMAGLYPEGEEKQWINNNRTVYRLINGCSLS
jgi:hypothetical protein